MALTFDDDQAAKLLTALGLDPTTTDIETTLATVQDAVTASTAEGAAPSAVAAAARRNGLEVLDADSLEALRRDANEGRKIAAAQAKAKIEGEVNDAIHKGKITPSRKQHWMTLLTNDPEMGKVLAGIAPETAVPLTELGHSISNDGSHTGEDANAGQWFY
ncbi:hypothetical protein MMUR_05450 [Mycolicibacterium murale]|uniref:Mu-like prophage I protein n=1 Tax=Mycolicibacterium murale TaxID=182220 RepID=A0A7I9WFV6_9MYCO|nr:hypothetical protein [Mycolicibacterium murale]MCV7182859.1 hypothetical protein [Mycolicibacterium murale]GFG56409.1 hypothetical protein MMUR_05450 [Mycolicibacterium murale]